LVNVENLHFVSETNAGFTRKSIRGKTHYLDCDGQRIADESVISRIKALAIPPAWTNVWICPLKNGHIQATGRDAKFRKQYRYHNLWRKVRDEAKYEQMIAFGTLLPAIRQGIASDLYLSGLPQPKVLATVVYLLQLTVIRIGNDEYAKNNNSYGLTTLRNKHIQINGSELHFEFKGKSGVHHSITVFDKRLAKLIKKIRDIPGQELFQYIDDQGLRHSINSSDVNDYLRHLTGANYTAKNFRTWYGTLEAAVELMKFPPFSSEVEARHNVAETIKTVAKKLGNTPTICRKCYIHPIIIDSYINGKLSSELPKLISKNSNKLPYEADTAQFEKIDLAAEEAALLDFLTSYV